MMQRIINLVAFILFASTAFSQVDPTMKFPTQEEVSVLEFQMNSVESDTASLIVYFNPLNTEEGKRKLSGSIYKRHASNFPLKLHMWYLFDRDSSEATNIIYNWGLYNPSFDANKNTELLYDLNRREAEFIEKFDSLYAQIASKLGKPTKIGRSIDKPHVLTKAYIWQTPERFITIRMYFTREIKHFPGIGYQTNNFEIQVSILQKIAPQIDK